MFFALYICTSIISQMSAITASEAADFSPYFMVATRSSTTPNRSINGFQIFQFDFQTFLSSVLQQLPYPDHIIALSSKRRESQDLCYTHFCVRHRRSEPPQIKEQPVAFQHTFYHQTTLLPILHKCSATTSQAPEFQ